jgi:uroporphyrinogen-III synthase
VSIEGADTGALAGRRILVTRRPEQSATLVARLKDLGAIVLELPTIAIAPPEDHGPLDKALGELHRYDWLVFTSANGVRAVGERMTRLGLPLAARGTALASVGAATTEALRQHFPGHEIALQPFSDFSAVGLAEAFLARDVAGQRFLLPVSAQARDVLERTLVDAGASVETVTAYRTLAPPGLAEQFEDILLKGLDLMTFASPSSVQHLQAAVGPRLHGLGAAVIGRVTEAAARGAGLDVRIVANPSTTRGLVEGLLRHYGAAGPS